jgi:hypothetical protein
MKLWSEEARGLGRHEVGNRDVWLLDNQHNSINVQAKR